MSKHVGHKVTVAGNLKAESYENEREKAESTKRRRPRTLTGIPVIHLFLIWLTELTPYFR